LDSSENSRLKEFKAKLSRKEKSTLKLVTTNNLQIESYIDVFSKEKRAHLDVKCEEHKITHVGDIILNRAERKISWDSKTNKNGKPYLTVESQLVYKGRTFLTAKKYRDDGQVSKFDYFYEKGLYGAELDSSKYSAVVEGENLNNRNFGKIGFVNKVDNYEHKSQYNISNGILTIKSISDKDKETASKLDAVIGLRIVSEVTLVSPKVNAKLTVNPLGEKKTLVYKVTSPRYDQDANVEWLPRKYLKLSAVSDRKVDPIRTVKVNAYLTRQEDSSFTLNAPSLDVDIKRLQKPKPHYVFNTTINC
jgi:hypothetical protein